MGSEHDQRTRIFVGLGAGTGGIYTPTVLTILGVILYMRMGWVVGNAGIWGTVGIVLLAVYHLVGVVPWRWPPTCGWGSVGLYIISRSLGLELEEHSGSRCISRRHCP